MEDPFNRKHPQPRRRSSSPPAALGEKTKQHEGLLPILRTAIDLAAGFDVANWFPSIKLLQMLSGLRRKLTRLHHEADKILDHIIDQHKQQTSDSDRGDEDLLDVLLRVQEVGLELPLTTDHVKAVILDMLAAGSETSATTMDWVMAEMVKNPSVLAKARDEVRQVYEEKGFVDESLLHKLEYLKAVVKETLRLHPPLPLLLPRKCGQTCEINGYEIPIDTKIIINAWSINRDPKYWEYPDCFEPERFVGSEVDYKGNNFEYIPFGAGRRMCPGISFGMANVVLPLAMFVYHFDWKLGAGMKHEEKMDMAEGFGVTAKREKDLFVIPEIRRPLPLK